MGSDVQFHLSPCRFPDGAPVASCLLVLKWVLYNRRAEAVFQLIALFLGAGTGLALTSLVGTGGSTLPFPFSE